MNWLNSPCVYIISTRRRYLHPPGIERDREFWLSLIQAQYACFWVAEQQQQVLGFCFARLLPAGLSFLRNRLLCHISTVVVDNRAQRQGIGASLVQAVERWAKQQRAAEVRLEVFDFNAAAIALYAKQGFHTAITYDQTDLSLIASAAICAANCET